MTQQSAKPSLETPISQPCTEAQFRSPLYADWCEKIGEHPCFHRKQWEFVYILQVLSHNGFLKPGFRGLGFGVGQEPLPAYFASLGIDVTATDMAPEKARAAGWGETNQHADSLNTLNARRLCDPDLFRKHARFETVDMNNIPSHLRGFDFTWSSCCFEHLGSIKAGLAFVRNSLGTLRPGGIAVHTSELNCSSNWLTISSGATVLFRKRDYLRLMRDLGKGGTTEHTFALGDGELDQYVDIPPYKQEPHLKLKIGRYVSTSYGVTVIKH